MLLNIFAKKAVRVTLTNNGYLLCACWVQSGHKFCAKHFDVTLKSVLGPNFYGSSLCAQFLVHFDTPFEVSFFRFFLSGKVF